MKLKRLAFGTAYAQGNIISGFSESHLFSYPCSTEKCHPIKVILKPGTYVIECWGAGGKTYANSINGKGAYTRGKITFFSSQILFLYIGSQNLGGIYRPDNISVGGYNGGGNSYFWAAPGCGASDVRLTNGEWNETASLVSRIMVAAGGGGANDNANGGYGGDINGGNGTHAKVNGCGIIGTGFGASQTSGGDGLVKGEFGKGGGYGYLSGEVNGAGGGGGYFGGGKAGGCEYSGGGGSSFISGHKNCISVQKLSQGSSEIKMNTTSIHYSSLSFTETVMISGNKEMPSPTGATETGHTGNGFIRITKVNSFVVTCQYRATFRSFNLFIVLLMSS